MECIRQLAGYSDASDSDLNTTPGVSRLYTAILVQWFGHDERILWTISNESQQNMVCAYAEARNALALYPVLKPLLKSAGHSNFEPRMVLLPRKEETLCVVKLLSVLFHKRESLKDLADERAQEALVNSRKCHVDLETRTELKLNQLEERSNLQDKQSHEFECSKIDRLLEDDIKSLRSLKEEQDVISIKIGEGQRQISHFNSLSILPKNAISIRRLKEEQVDLVQQLQMSLSQYDPKICEYDLKIRANSQRRNRLIKLIDSTSFRVIKEQGHIQTLGEEAFKYKKLVQELEDELKKVIEHRKKDNSRITECVASNELVLSIISTPIRVGKKMTK